MRTFTCENGDKLYRLDVMTSTELNLLRHVICRGLASDYSLSDQEKIFLKQMIKETDQ